MNYRLGYAFALIIASGGLHAGNGPAGPPGGGSTAPGSTVIPLDSSSAQFDTPDGDDDSNRDDTPDLPGQVGVTQLTPAQTTRLAANLGSGPDTVVSGNLIRAPLLLADGTAGTLLLNTETGELRISRNDS